VAVTIGGILKAEQVADRPEIIIAALLGACVWEILTWLWALPMSSSHALVGGLAWRGVGGPGCWWDRLAQGHPRVCLSPHLPDLGDRGGGICSCASAGGSSVGGNEPGQGDRFYKHMQILSSSWVSFSHGSNDASKVMGIIVIYLAAQEGLGVKEYVAAHGFSFGLPLWWC